MYSSIKMCVSSDLKHFGTIIVLKIEYYFNVQYCRSVALTEVLNMS